MSKEIKCPKINKKKRPVENCLAYCPYGNPEHIPGTFRINLDKLCQYPTGMSPEESKNLINSYIGNKSPEEQSNTDFQEFVRQSRQQQNQKK